DLRWPAAHLGQYLGGISGIRFTWGPHDTLLENPVAARFVAQGDQCGAGGRLLVTSLPEPRRGILWGLLAGVADRPESPPRRVEHPTTPELWAKGDKEIELALADGGYVFGRDATAGARRDDATTKLEYATEVPGAVGSCPWPAAAHP